jgi:hypothetical protein
MPNWPKIEDPELRLRLGELLHHNAYYGAPRSWKAPVGKDEIKELITKTYPHDVKNKDEAEAKKAFIEAATEHTMALRPGVSDVVKEEWMKLADRFVFDLCKRFGLVVTKEDLK